MKRKLRKELKELNKGWINKEDYMIKRRKYKEWCEEEAWGSKKRKDKRYKKSERGIEIYK